MRAGESIDDLCRVCKQVRRHSVVAVDSEGKLLQVVCDYCGSRHRFRGGDRAERARSAAPTEVAAAGPRTDHPLVSERERALEPLELVAPEGGTMDLEMLLRRVIREETGVTPVAPAERWRGGELVLRPGKPGLQEKSWPIETILQKVVSIRNRLRVLEQQINAREELASDVKLKLQSYITGCYGSLTSFNVLFADEDDRFKGSAS
ncbi:MAG: hypothetical protein JSV80_13560 [Acidobacteriota bacterium]|nr:MAG: hypothetical protein JSV80_13560 [Acidobacteriota bacterium]